mmetsp:Transcript_79585/g.133313  ORF Transcript_79585/g.133313 Transcript_79585/m.133313 type:complete len:242 (+) Transcript_79585:1743-2468(+)
MECADVRPTILCAEISGAGGGSAHADQRGNGFQPRLQWGNQRPKETSGSCDLWDKYSALTHETPPPPPTPHAHAHFPEIHSPTSHTASAQFHKTCLSAMNQQFPVANLLHFFYSPPPPPPPPSLRHPLPRAPRLQRQPSRPPPQACLAPEALAILGGPACPTPCTPPQLPHSIPYHCRPRKAADHRGWPFCPQPSSSHAFARPIPVHPCAALQSMYGLGLWQVSKGWHRRPIRQALARNHR